MASDHTHPQGRPASRARMRNLDGMPQDFRLLSHEFGTFAFKFYLRGYEVEDARIKALSERAIAHRRALKAAKKPLARHDKPEIGAEDAI